jgi:hypothetical protein
VPRVTRTTRDRVRSKRILTGGEIDKVESEEWNKALGGNAGPDVAEPPRPRQTTDMATRADVRRRVDRHLP